MKDWKSRVETMANSAQNQRVRDASKLYFLDTYVSRHYIGWGVQHFIIVMGHFTACKQLDDPNEAFLTELEDIYHGNTSTIYDRLVSNGKSIRIPCLSGYKIPKDAYFDEMIFQCQDSEFYPVNEVCVPDETVTTS